MLRALLPVAGAHLPSLPGGEEEERDDTVRGVVMRAVREAGGVAAVLGAMAAHPESERVQTAGAEALRRMAESSDAARRALCSEPEAMMGSGGVPVLIRAMSSNPDSPEIAEAAGSVLVAVAKQGDEGEKAVGKEGRAALAEASKNFPEVSYYDWLVSWF